VPGELADKVVEPGVVELGPDDGAQAGDGFAARTSIVWTHGMRGRCRACTIDHEPSLCEKRRRYMSEPAPATPTSTAGYQSTAMSTRPPAGSACPTTCAFDQMASWHDIKPVISFA